MLDSFLFSVTVGTVLGFLSGLGIGGGSLLILWLTLVRHMPQELARSINLMFFLPAAAVAIFFRFRKGRIPLQTVLPAMGAGILGALLLGMLTAGMDTHGLRIPFGILLLLTGLREVLYKPKA